VTVIDVIPMIKAPSAGPTWLVGAVAMLLLAALKCARISTHRSLGLVVKSLRSPKPPRVGDEVTSTPARDPRRLAKNPRQNKLCFMV